MENMEKSDDVESDEGTMKHCYFMNLSQLPSLMKENTREVRLLELSRMIAKTEIENQLTDGQMRYVYNQPGLTSK